MVLVILMNLLVMAAVFLAVSTLFRAPVETQDEFAFRIEIDNVDRDTLFEAPAIRPFLVPIYHVVRRLNLPGVKKHILKLLLALGNPNQYTADEYLVICVVWGVVGAMALWSGAWAAVGYLSLPALVAFVIVGFGVGFLVAYLWLRERALARLRAISKRLPYTLDLIAMAMDAGATFYEAASAVTRDDPEEPLNQELGMVVREIDFGRSRQDALTHLGRRIDVDGLDSILSAVLQAEQLGTPLAHVLKLQANLLRMRRSMRAERRAGEASVKMLVPSMLILMAVVLVIFAPIIVRAIRGQYLD
ncbi:MAG TPA: type II secretion system F family protein [Phycisphaerae bacterium]|nr:type II secretion system F family protein [Phycisphaerae bacterium]